MWKLLLVDDEDIIREGLRDNIPWMDATIRIVGEASDGEEALRKANALRPDIVLVDIVMPGLTGIDFVKELRKVDERCRVVFLSAHQKIDYFQNAFKVSAVDYLLKPVDIGELVAVMRRISSELENEQNEQKRLRDLEALVLRRRLEEKEKRNNDSIRVRQIKSAVEACFDRDVSLEEIANIVGISVAHMEAHFKTETGHTVHDYLSRYRMEKAKSLLTDPRYRVYEVANAVGYRDPNYFCRVFKKTEGVSPGDFRNGK